MPGPALLLDLAGVFFFALSGTLLAVRKGFDITGGLLLGGLAGLGGGLVRDLVLDLPPLALTRPVYLVAPLVATAVVYLAGPHIERGRVLIVTCDAAGLGLFCASGAALALAHGAGVVAAVVLGVTTAAGGGLIRDVVADEEPAVFHASDLYVVPAAVGAGLAVAAYSQGWWSGPVQLGIGTLVFAFRMTAWWRGWRVPGSTRGWTLRRAGRRRRTRGGGGRAEASCVYDDPRHDPDLD